MRLRDYILISAALGGDFIDSLRLGFGAMPSAMKNMYGFVPRKYKRVSYVTAVSKMLSTGDIEKVVGSSGKVYLQLTSKGEVVFKRRFPLFMQAKKWDGYFMVVSFDIPESYRAIRDSLRNKLSEIGFGMLQKSVWISPYHFEEDIREFLLAYHLEEMVFVLSARKVLAGDIKSLARRVWKLERINRGYKKAVRLLRKSLRLKDKQRENFLQSAKVKFLDTLSKDPLLPKEFLSETWVGVKARKIFNNYV